MWQQILEVEAVRYIMFFMATIFGLAFGKGVIYFYNRFPKKWLSDYGEKEGNKGLQYRPWRGVFSMVFIASGIYISERIWLSNLDKWQMVALFMAFMITFIILVLIGLADFKYKVIPDQLIVILAVTAISFSPYKDGFLEPLWGSLVGVLTFALLNLIFKRTYHRNVIGKGNVKLMFAIGLLMGLQGTVAVMIFTFVMAGIFLSLRIVRGDLRKRDELSLAPFISAACYLCLLFDIGSFLF